MILLVYFVVALSGHSVFSDASNSLQAQCSELIKQGMYTDWQRALLCGVSPPKHQMIGLSQLGLAHLIVVSGAHLVFLTQILNTFLCPKFLRVPILIFYGFAAGLQPPIVRALFQIGLPFERPQSILASGLLAWIFFRDLSLSLALSWSASLLIEWPSQSEDRNGLNPFLKSLLIHIGLAPLLIPIGLPFVFAILINPIASILFGAILFPLTIVNAVLPFHFVSFITDSSWKCLLMSVEHLCKTFPSTLPSPLYFPHSIYILCVHVVFQNQRLRALRKKYWTK